MTRAHVARRSVMKCGEEGGHNFRRSQVTPSRHRRGSVGAGHGDPASDLATLFLTSTRLSSQGPDSARTVPPASSFKDVMTASACRTC